VTVPAALIVTVHVDDVPVQPAVPPQPVNVAAGSLTPGLGCAVKVTLVPAFTEAEHVPEAALQSIEPTLLVTLPLPVTVTVTDTLAA